MSLNILAVDDSRTIRDMLKLALNDAGFTLHLAEDGMHGLEVLDGIEPDAIISDINMPRLENGNLLVYDNGNLRPGTTCISREPHAGTDRGITS